MRRSHKISRKLDKTLKILEKKEKLSTKGLKDSVKHESLKRLKKDSTARHS